MKTDSDAIILPSKLEGDLVGDDLYLQEMTQRLQKLRSLLGEAEVRKSRPKRWAEKAKSLRR